MLTKRSGAADRPRHQTTGGIHQRSTVEDGQLELISLRRLQPMQLCEERRDAVVPDCIRLSSDGRDTGQRCVTVD